jgi:hypothetical protein
MYQIPNGPHMLAPAPPLTERPARHALHFQDNRNMGEMWLLSMERNSFYVYVKEHHVDICPPLEATLHTPLWQVVSAVKNLGHWVHLHVEGDELSSSNTDIQTNGMRHRMVVYQALLPADTYEQKLRRFAKKGYTYRRLDIYDASQLASLGRMWASQKLNHILFPYPSWKRDEEPNEEQIFIFSREYDQFKQQRIDPVKKVTRTVEDYKAILQRPATALYGCFAGNDLLAFTEIEGNDSCLTFQERSGSRRNSHSPQEYLDLCVLRGLSSRGIKSVGRGVYQERPDAKSLLSYKEKFGPITMRSEWTWNYVAVSPKIYTMRVEPRDLHAELRQVHHRLRTD